MGASNSTQSTESVVTEPQISTTVNHIDAAVQKLKIADSNSTGTLEQTERTDTSNTTTIPATSELQPPTVYKIKLLYGTQSGTAKQFTHALKSQLDTYLNKHCHTVQYTTTISNVHDFDTENLSQYHIVLCIISTYIDGTPPDTAKVFYSELQEMCNDFRVDRQWLHSTHYAVLGLGSTIYEQHYNTVGRTIDSNLHSIGGKRIIEFGECDAQTNEIDVEYRQWCNTLLPAINTVLTGTAIPINTNSSDTVEYDSDVSAQDVDSGDDVLDVEDMGKTLKQQQQQQSNTTIKPMLTDSLRKSLNKQGYKLIGTHSGVKLCRWTKAMLRDRGGCYKHTFYGIESSSCMELTPSLACANKCVFCWRHHTNPVGREWRWQVDEPEFILNEAIKHHTQMIKMQRGVPGVTNDNFAKAQTIKHCALSLVGEPIMYPYINEFIHAMHNKHISTFLVTNAQFPDSIHTLQPVTQLYVSIDAATESSLKAVDRPLFKDFWQRYMQSLQYIALKPQRTVYRLTLVKSYNMTELQEYGKLIQLGKPTFIEIKGVTFAGQNRNNMTMSDVPYHYEVVLFAQQLIQFIDTDVYELACEHQHSCSVLIADKKLKINNKWHTWIDYTKYNELILQYYATGQQFTTVDYCCETPAWAIYDAVEHGFDPTMTRTHTRGSAGRAAKQAIKENAANKLIEYESKEGEEIHVVEEQKQQPHTSLCGPDCHC